MRFINLLRCASKEYIRSWMGHRKAILNRTQIRHLSLLSRSPSFPVTASSTPLPASFLGDAQRIPIIPPITAVSRSCHFSQSQRHWNSHSDIPNVMTETEYEALAEQTLNSLHDFFDLLPEICSCSDEYDAEFGNGVLTIRFDSEVGTYVINKQTPNKQIWLSSPKTGPKRYDFCGNKWIYRHDGVSLHQLLEEEISEIFGSKVSLKDCKHYS